MKKIIIAIIVSMILESCFPNRNISEISFINEYGSENFSIFKNTSFTLRGIDNEGNKIIFVYDTIACGYIKVLLNKDSLSPVSVVSVPLKKECNITTDTVKVKLSQLFAKYNLNYLAVNKYNNVFFKTRPYEGKPNLLLLNDSLHIDNLDLSDWERIQNKWYILKSK